MVACFRRGERLGYRVRPRGHRVVTSRYVGLRNNEDAVAECGVSGERFVRKVVLLLVSKCSGWRLCLRKPGLAMCSLSLAEGNNGRVECTDASTLLWYAARSNEDRGHGDEGGVLREESHISG
jgi:hypothetical protein